jgi:VWFA-related protein
MARCSFRLILQLAIVMALAAPSFAQDPAPQSPSQAGGAQAVPDQSSYMLKTYTRLVNLEVVAKDGKGNHIQGLNPGDFEIDEQTPEKSKKWSPQRVASFQEVHMASLAAPALTQSQMEPGVYTNAVAAEKEPVPPTILLVDGLNTQTQYQAQVHVQMIRLLRQLPRNVPVSVFLLGDRLEILQSFTSDPKLLQAALDRSMSTASVGMANLDPRDDPDSANSAVAKVGGGRGDATIETIRNFDERIFMATVDERVDRTINALTSLGHSVSGYPGRKNLLWLSTSFPINLTTILAVGATSDLWSEAPSYWPQLRRLSAVLSDAKVAVYPVNLAGVQTLQVYQAAAQPPNLSPSGFSNSMTRDELMQNASVDTMHEIAEGTGGIVCTGDNDLGDCVRKAVEDSSDFYEISYYSDSGDWNGEFRRIAVKTSVKGARLAYREGYYATLRGSSDPKVQSKQLQSDCGDYLDATSVTFLAKNVQSDSPDQIKFSLLINTVPLTFAPTVDGGHNLNLDVAVCTYNEKHWPLKLINYPVKLKLNEQQYETAMSTGKLADTIRVPGPKPAALRLIVKDVATGKLGSIYIKTGEPVANAGH